MPPGFYWILWTVVGVIAILTLRFIIVRWMLFKARKAYRYNDFRRVISLYTWLLRISRLIVSPSVRKVMQFVSWHGIGVCHLQLAEFSQAEAPLENAYDLIQLGINIDFNVQLQSKMELLRTRALLQNDEDAFKL